MPKNYRKKTTKPVSKAVKKYVKQKLDKDVEDKEIRSPAATVDQNLISDTLIGNWYVINGIANGPNQGQRLGQTIKMKSYAIRGFLEGNFAAPPPTPVQVRLIVMVDKQPNGFQPDVTFLLGDAASGIQTQEPILHASRSRYWVLLDKSYMLNLSAGSDVIWRVNINEKVNLRNMKTTYKNTTGALIGDITTNALLVGWVSDQFEEAAVRWGGLLVYEDA